MKLKDLIIESAGLKTLTGLSAGDSGDDDSQAKELKSKLGKKGYGTKLDGTDLIVTSAPDDVKDLKKALEDILDGFGEDFKYVEVSS